VTEKLCLSLTGEKFLRCTFVGAREGWGAITAGERVGDGDAVKVSSIALGPGTAAVPLVVARAAAAFSCSNRRWRSRPALLCSACMRRRVPLTASSVAYSTHSRNASAALKCCSMADSHLPMLDSSSAIAAYSWALLSGKRSAGEGADMILWCILLIGWV